jgi:hypothetical protein
LEQDIAELDGLIGEILLASRLDAVTEIARRHGGDACCAVMSDGRSSFVITLPQESRAQ